MNFVITMIPITNTELTILSRGDSPLGNWMADAMAQRQFAGQSLVEQSYSEELMPAIFDAIGVDRKRTDRQIAVYLSAHELAAACSRFTMVQHQSMPITGSPAFIAQASNTVCAALVHWCPHVYITIDRIED